MKKNKDYGIPLELEEARIDKFAIVAAGWAMFILGLIIGHFIWR